MQAVILAGGKGTRLQERLDGRPKPLVNVNGAPLLEHQISFLRAQGVDSLVILVSHAANLISEFLASRGNFGLPISVLNDGTPRGTAGAVLGSLAELEDRFLVVYGDTLFNIDTHRFEAAHEAARADVTLFLHPNDHPADSDLVEVDENGSITAFHPYPHPAGAYFPNLVNAAFYMVERRSLEPWLGLQVPADFGKDLFPAMLEAGLRLHGYLSFEYIKDLGTPRRLDSVVADLRCGKVERASFRVKQSCVFLDRDGTLNELRGYVCSPDDLVVFSGVPEAVRRLNEREYRVAVITNQPVIARGECSFEMMRSIHAKLDSVLGENGAFLDRIYMCPHHPDSGFPGEVRALKVNCDCRKPSTGLIEQASRDLEVDLSASWMVGDSTADIIAARRAGVRSILVETGEAGRDGKFPATADYIVPDLAAAVQFILNGYPRLSAGLAGLVDRIGAGDLVLIGGLARAGKSMLASVLASELRKRGKCCSTIALDRWIRSEAERAAPGVEHRFELDAAWACLGAWLDGGAAGIEAPIYDRARRLRSGRERIGIPGSSVLIVEGVPALLRRPSTPRRIHAVYVEIDEAFRRERVLADLRARGAVDLREAEAIYLGRTVDETPCIVESRGSADYIVTLDEIDPLSLTFAS